MNPVRVEPARTLTAHMADRLGAVRDANDQELLREFVSSRSVAAFEELVRRTADMVYSAARRQMGGAELAEDVAQAVFLVLARKAQKVDGVLAGWLLGVTFNACRNAKRMAARRAYHERRAGVMKLQTAPSDPEIVWSDYAPVIDVAMHRLRREDRDVIAMRFFRGTSFKEVGASLGINEEAARKRVERAVGRLRVALSERTAAPAVAVLASHLSTKAIEAAPAKVVETIVASLVSGAKGTAAGTIASKTVHAMTLVKIKVAAAILLTIGAVGVGTGTVIKLASEMSLPIGPTPAPSLNASPTQSAQGTVHVVRLAPEGQFPGETQLVQWSVLLSDSVTAAIRPTGRPVQTASTGYQAYLFNGGMLRADLALNMRGTNVIADANSMQFAFPAGPDRLLYPNNIGQILEINPQNSGIAFLNNPYSGASDIQRVGDGLQMKLDFRQIALRAGAAGLQNNLNWGPELRTSIQFDGPLALGDALGLLARLVAPGGKAINCLIVFETFHLRSQEPLLNEHSSAWWIVHGPQTLRDWGKVAYVWKQNSAPDQTHAPDLPSIALEDGKTLRLEGLSRPSQWPGCWWDAAGSSAEPCDGLLLMDGDPPKGVWACVKVEGPKGEYLVRQPVVKDPAFGDQYSDWQSGRVANDSAPLDVGVLVGPWKELARVRAGESAVIDGVTYTFAPRSDGSGPFRIRIARRGAADDSKLLLEYVAVGIDGKQVASQQYSQDAIIGSEPHAYQFQGGANFSGINFADVAYFKIMGRKRQWVSFGQFVTEPRLTPPATVSEGDVEKAMALAARNGDQAMLNEITRDRTKWETIAADPTVPSGATRLLADRARQGNETGVREMIFATDSRIQPELDSIAHYLTQCAINRKKLVDRFGEVAVQNKVNNICPDIEDQFIRASWTRNSDGSYSQGDGLRMQKLADGKFHFNFNALATPESVEMLKNVIAMEDELTARLAKDPPPTLDEINSYWRVMATTRGAN